VTQLRELDKALVIQDNDKPIALLLKYDQFMAMQNREWEYRIVDYPNQKIDFMVEALKAQAEDPSRGSITGSSLAPKRLRGDQLRSPESRLRGNLRYRWRCATWKNQFASNTNISSRG